MLCLRLLPTCVSAQSTLLPLLRRGLTLGKPGSARAMSGGDAQAKGLSSDPKSAVNLDGPSKEAAGAKSALMIDTEDFASLRKDMENFDGQRETVIKRSRDVQKLAKQAIFSAHRGDEPQCTKRLLEAEGIARELLPLIQDMPDLRHGSFSNSMEEYAEAKAFQMFLKERRVISSKELDMVSRDEFLGGMLDFTGELNRYAVARATKRDVIEVQRCRNIVEGLMGEFLQFDLRNGSTRKKYDALKYTLKKLENTLYELSLAEAGFKPQTEPDAPQQAAGEQEAPEEH